MASLEIETKTVQISNGDLAIDAYLATPKQEGSYPGIIVVQEIFGVNDHIRDITRRLASEGYVAVAPAIYQRIAPGLELGYTEEDITLGRSYKEQTQADELLNDIKATIDYLYSLPQVQRIGVGTIGFCYGGHVVYLVAVLDEIKATASFYGAGITNSTPGGGEPTINRTKDIKGTIYAFFGLEDPLIPNEQPDEIEAALKKHNISYQIFRYPNADHGFLCDQRGSYNPEVAADAWQQVLSLFNTTLKK
ncbi:dienelactone hydrolase family protein [Gloeothece verrucosa]|uniref:Dienelactone hydrolase n=1 Tax=Gloeothece verrucosa (strain PCC 7822) TaxID=497965 RepID=E0U8Z0_GLOV7|nr:dienelactone hydrolase family protein [Gloeothece verrucosa]ADN16129.1 dienelactone hydrolase [Gloeothece verrucosa PCC 7822]